MQYETCRHVKEDGAYCGSPALRDQKYCYYHLMQRGRRLRRARALADELPYRIEIQSLDNPYAIRTALTEIAQALAAGQLEARAAGKLLYAVQLVSATNRRIEQMEAARLEETKDAEDQTRAACPERSRRDDSRIQEYPDFEKHFGIPPDSNLEAETEAALRKAAEEARIAQRYTMPEPPAGVRVGSPAFRVYREEAYQSMRLQLQDMHHQLREYNEQKRQEVMKEFENARKDVLSATPAPNRRADTA